MVQCIQIILNIKLIFIKINNEINWFTGKARIKGDIWLKRVDGKKGKDPKIEILAKGNCEKNKRKSFD